MTREDAKEILDHNWTKLVNPDYSDEELGEAQNLAIEVLSVEPPRMGEWIVNKRLGGRFQCSECAMFSGLTEEDVKEGYPLAKYCSNCGAKMKGSKE